MGTDGTGLAYPPSCRLIHGRFRQILLRYSKIDEHDTTEEGIEPMVEQKEFFPALGCGCPFGYSEMRIVVPRLDYLLDEIGALSKKTNRKGGG